MSWLQDFSADWLSFLGAIKEMEFWEEGFITGLAVGLVPFFLLLLIMSVCRRRRRCRGVSIAGENGDLYVTINAIREFVTRILCEFSETSLRSVDLKEKRGMLILTIGADAIPGTDLVGLRERVSSRVLQEATAKLGTERVLKRVNVTIHSYTADHAKIARKTRKITALPPTPPDAEPTE